ncbi:hypothetical protein D3C85_1904960 [compost metagenome]
MMAVASTTVQSPSCKTGNFRTGHSAVSSAKAASPSSSLNSNGVLFSYSAISAFWQ